MKGRELRRYRRKLKRDARKDRREERKENRIEKRNYVLENNTIADRKGRRKARGNKLLGGIKKAAMLIAALILAYVILFN